MESLYVYSESAVHISLVLATVDRCEEIEILLASLAAQTCGGFELIVVDQNADERLSPLLESWKDRITLLHLRASPGLSRARNIGLKLATGGIVGFPDDDCWYPRTLLASVDAWLRENTDISLLCCIARDTAERESTTRWPRRSGPIDRKTVLRTCSSPCLFVRRQAAVEIGGFDETMGLGAATPFQSAEDLDFAMRILESGRAGFFERMLQIYHPLRSPDALPPARAYGYGMGFGRLLRLHGYSPFACMYHALRAVGGIVLALLKGSGRGARFHWRSLRGRIAGYLCANHPLMRVACIAETRSGEKS